MVYYVSPDWGIRAYIMRKTESRERNYEGIRRKIIKTAGPADKGS